MFLNHVDGILQKTVLETPQKDDDATHAPKITSDECVIDFDRMSSRQVYNKWRAFGEKPGISTTLYKADGSTLIVKIHRMKVLENAMDQVSSPFLVYKPSTGSAEACLEVTCGDGSRVALLAVQPLTKKIITAKELHNGIRKETLRWKR